MTLYLGCVWMYAVVTFVPVGRHSADGLKTIPDDPSLMIVGVPMMSDDLCDLDGCPHGSSSGLDPCDGLWTSVLSMVHTRVLLTGE
jgi:hypothetical protein